VDGVGGVVSGVYAVPGVEGTCGTDDELVEVVVGVGVVVVYAGVVVEVVVAGHVDTACVVEDGCDEGVAFLGVVVEAGSVLGLEGGFVGGDENVGLCVGGELAVEPGLVDIVGEVVVEAAVHIEHGEECVLVGHSVGHVLFAGRAVVGESVVGVGVWAEDFEPPAGEGLVWFFGGGILGVVVEDFVVSAAGIDGDAGVVEGLDDFEPLPEEVFEVVARDADAAGQIAREQDEVDAAVEEFLDELGEDGGVDAAAATAIAGHGESPGFCVGGCGDEDDQGDEL